MGSLGGAELVFVLVLALLLFGPRRLPKIGQTIGKTLGDLRKATTDFKMNLEKEVDLDEVRELHGTVKDARREMKATVGEFKDLGIPRDPLDLNKPDPARPAAPAKTDSPAPVAPTSTEPQPPAPPAATPAGPPEPAGEPVPMEKPNETPEGSMSLLDHLDELRSRLFRTGLVFVVALGGCWAVSEPVLSFLMRPIQEHLFEGGEIVFINLTEPFMIYVKASALAALFLSSPYILYQVWAFVAPGLYRRERRMVIPFLLFGTLFFVAGGAFGYYVATPVAAAWLIGLGENYQAAITLRSAFSFLSRVIIGMGAVFELPILIFFLSRIGVVTPRFLMRHFRTAVLIIAVLAAIITPTGDVLTMSVFAGPMILLYLLGVLVSWVFGRRDEPDPS